MDSSDNFWFSNLNDGDYKNLNSYISRRIYSGAVNLFLFRHCPSKIYWECTIWNINIQYENDWYTLQKLTKPVFAFRQWENLVSSSINPSWSSHIKRQWHWMNYDCVVSYLYCDSVTPVDNGTEKWGVGESKDQVM